MAGEVRSLLPRNESAEEVDCIVCNGTIDKSRAKSVRTGSTLLGYRHSTCAIPDYMREKYPNIR